MSSARLTSTPQGNNQQEECDPAALSGDSGSGSGPTVGAVIDAVSRNEGDTDQLDFSRLAQRNKRLESTGCALVAQALSTNHTVRRLIMRDHAIGDDGAAALADMLCRNSTLEYIDLFGNDITDDGAEALAQALYGHESVTHLLLWSNRITDRGAKALADALKCNIALQYLGLVDNLITQAGALAFLHALEVNVHLESLDLGANNVPDWLTTQVRVVLARNRLEAPRNKLVLGCASPVIKEDFIARYEAGENEGENNSGHESIGSGESSSSEGSASGFLSCSEITNISSQSSSGMWI